MSTNDKTDTTAAPLAPTWRDRAEAERKATAQARASERTYPAGAAGYGKTLRSGVDLAKMDRIEVQAVAARGRARALDEEAGIYRREAQAHAIAAFAGSLYTPASERYDLASIRPFLEDPAWPERKLIAENIGVHDLRLAVREYELAAAMAAAANGASREYATLNQLLANLKRYADPSPSAPIPNAGPRMAV
ncbi:MAG: hypothetical protein IV093_04775 [Rubrivivax sp.]|nr:hypothetical protein [Rubrivivax sp.]